jgi:hypothetical protein
MISAGTFQRPARTSRVLFPVLSHPEARLVFMRTGHSESKGAYVSLYEFREIYVPNFKRNWEGEKLDASLVNFEAFLKVLVFFQECSIIDNDLGVRNAELQDFVIYTLCGLHRPEGLLEIDIERPELE